MVKHKVSFTKESRYYDSVNALTSMMMSKIKSMT